MKRQWRAPNNPTGPARQVWAHLFPHEPWPTGWRVAWAGFMRGARGLTLWSERRILLSYGDHAGRRFRTGWDGPQPLKPGAVDTLLHEFVHMRCGKRLRHGAEFTRLENALRERLWGRDLHGEGQE